MKTQNKIKFTPVFGLLVIGLVMSSPMTILPNISAQQADPTSEIINRIPADVGPLKNITTVPIPTESFTGEHKVMPPGPIRESKDAPFKDMQMCGAPLGAKPEQAKCVVVPGIGSGSSWAEGPTFYPQGSGYSSYNGIGAAPQVISLGGTSLSTPVTFEVETLNLIDTNGHHWGLQNTISWGSNSDCGSTGYAEEFWLFDITGNHFYRTGSCITSSIVGNQYTLLIYYNTSTSQWNFKIADGTTHSITEISGIPSASLSAVDSTTTAANEGQFPILLESADTTTSDFNSFEIDMFGSEIKSGGSWVVAGSGCCTVNIPAYSYYSNYALAASSLHLVDQVGGTLTAPTTVGYEGHTENGVYGPGINISKSGYDNYWVCPISCGSPPPIKVQTTSPGAGYGPYAGYSLW